MDEFLFGKFTLIAKDLREHCLKTESDEVVCQYVAENWLQEKTACIYAGKNCSYITIPPFSGIGLFVGESVITDDLSVLEKKGVDTEAVEMLCSYGFVSAPHTLYSNIRKLPPWCALRINPNTSELSFWKIPFPKDLETNREDRFALLVEQAIRDYDDSEKTAVGFSGGLDSSVLVHLLKRYQKKVDLYSVYALNGRDESFYQRQMLGTSYRDMLQIEIREADALQSLKRIASKEELFGSSLAIKYDFMAKKLSERGYTCAITGDGPDDLLISQGEVDTFFDLKKKRMMSLYGLPGETFLPLPTAEPEGLVEDAWYWYNFFLAAQTNIYFLKQYCADYDVKVCMPYLDGKIVQYCATESRKIFLETEKQRIKECPFWTLPPEILTRKKMGFTSDIALWLHPGTETWEMAQQQFSKQDADPFFRCLNALGKQDMELLQHDYEPNARTHGRGHINHLYTILQISLWKDSLQDK